MSEIRYGQPSGGYPVCCPLLSISAREQILCRFVQEESSVGSMLTQGGRVTEAGGRCPPFHDIWHRTVLHDGCLRMNCGRAAWLFRCSLRAKMGNKSFPLDKLEPVMNFMPHSEMVRSRENRSSCADPTVLPNRIPRHVQLLGHGGNTTAVSGRSTPRDR